MADRIMTRHPEGKAGVNIEKAKYDLIKRAILAVLMHKGSATFTELSQTVEKMVRGSFEGKVPWYVVTVKLDLEARGKIRRIMKSGRQVLCIS